MESVQLKLTGATELADKLRQMPAKLEKKALQVSVLKALDDVLPDMIDAMPDDIDQHRSPSSEQFGTAKQNLRVISLKNVGRNQKGARIDTGKAFWMLWYEFGSRHQQARAVFAPKIRQLAQKVIDFFGRDVGTAIEMLWKEK